MKKSIFKTFETALLSLAGVLIFILLLYLCLTPNSDVFAARDTSHYNIVDNVDYSETTDDSGLIRQFRFTIDNDITYDTTLIFRFHHQNADVYLDGEKVYSLHASEKMSLVKTPGGNVAMIPLYREDCGKEVLVELRPVYKNYTNQAIQFIIGSKLAVYSGELVKALPEMMLCFADIFAGLLLLFIGIYLSSHKGNGSGFFSMSLLAIALGLWNFSQTTFSLFVLPEKNTLVYYISLTMLTISVFALIKCIRKPENKYTRILLNAWTIIYSVFITSQMVLQLLGILDLRITLKGVHIALAITAITLIIGNMTESVKVYKRTGNIRNIDCVWILGCGAMLDLLNYYTDIITSKLVFVLLAVLIYVLIGGFNLFRTFVLQRAALEEKENQLTLSRVTTMMSQIRSHFVFNVLNAISGMCKYDPEKADETIVRFSRYLRSNIDIMEDDKNVPFLQELDRLEDYVVLEQIRFGDKIEFTTDIQADDFSIPPLILQPIVENAIKHGISKKIDGGLIKLSTEDSGNNIIITVSDNGIGFRLTELNKQSSVGLRNIRFRLYHLVGGNMDIKSFPGVGTTVTLTLPKEKTQK